MTIYDFILSLCEMLSNEAHSEFLKARRMTDQVKCILKAEDYFIDILDQIQDFYSDKTF